MSLIDPKAIHASQVKPIFAQVSELLAKFIQLKRGMFVCFTTFICYDLILVMISMSTYMTRNRKNSFLKLLSVSKNKIMKCGKKIMGVKILDYPVLAKISV